MKRIVLITTGQPSTNPRIVKEANLFWQEGYHVTLLYCYYTDWAEKEDKKLLSNVGWHFQMVGGSPEKNKVLYIITRIRFKICKSLFNLFGNSLLLAERSQTRCFDELLRAAKNIKGDFFIGHNLGALSVAAKAAKFHNAKAGFDFEDYHFGELQRSEKKILKRIIYLENKYLPGLKYFSTSSDLITIISSKNHPNFPGVIITLKNSFPLSQQPSLKLKERNDNSLQLFWFSQTIGLQRGLEELISALQILNDSSIHLTLAGRCDERFTKYIKMNANSLLSNIHFAGIIHPEGLPEFASKFDLGMAIETGFSHNNKIALSNKIFTYLLAGNAMILSETEMQSLFNKKFSVGESFALNDVRGLAGKIKVYQNHNKLNAQKKYNYELAKNELNWEIESRNLRSIMKKIL